MRRLLIFLFAFLFIFSYCAKAAKFILSSTPDGKGAIYVNDDIKITLEGDDYSYVIVDDENGNPNSIAPIEFEANEGDVLEIEAIDKSEPARMKSDKVPVPSGRKALSPIYLVYEGAGFAVPIFGGLPETNSSWEGEDTFVKITYKIGTLMKLYCLSSVSDGCSPIYVNEDMPLFKFDYGDYYSVEIHPDNDGDDSHIAMDIALPVLEDESITPTYEVKFVNRRKDGELSRVYLVPKDGGIPITIVAQPKWIDGDCEKFPECDETTIYSYEGPLSLPVASYGGVSSLVAEFSKTYHENGREGIYYNISLTQQPPVNIFVYWNVLGEANLFYTPSGYSIKGEPIPIYSDLKGEILLPDYNVFQKVFVSGSYKLGVLSENGDKFEYQVNLEPDEGDLKDAENLELTDSNISSENDFTETESYLVDDLLKGYSSRIYSSYYIDIPVESNNGTVTERCYFYPVNIYKKISNGFAYRYVSEMGAEFIFAMNVLCDKITDNGTEPDDGFAEKILDQVDVGVTYTYENQTVNLKLNKIAVKPIAGETSETAAGLYFVYNSIQVPMDLSAHDISYYFHGVATTASGTFTTAQYSYTVKPPEVLVRSPEGFVNGLLLRMNTTPGGTITVNANFGVDLEPLVGSVDFSKYRAEVKLDLDSDGNYDVNLGMVRDYNKFRVSYNIPLSSSGSFSYKIFVYDEDGRQLGGRFLNQKHTVSLSNSEDIALGVSGYSAYVFGDTMKFTLSAVTSTLSEDSYDVYLGLYKKGRGIVWMIDAVPGAGVYKTSVEKKPLLFNIDSSYCASGCSWAFDIQIPSRFDFFAPFYYGKYVWILEFTKHGSTDAVATLYYPFTIKIK